MNKLIPVIFVISLLLAYCQPKPKPVLSPEETALYIEKGQEIVQQSFKTLSGQLAGALQKGGVQEAVRYCNIKANPIMDSLSQAYRVKISRVTLHPRRPEDMANENESKILADYLNTLGSGETAEPFIQATSRDDVTFYAPILIISPLCLKCHGKVGTEISTEDYSVIKSLYPEDQATGYEMNDLRGLWVISFNKNFKF